MTPKQEDQLAETVDCPMCKVSAGQRCVNVFDRRDRGMPHARRLLDAIARAGGGTPC